MEPIPTEVSPGKILMCSIICNVHAYMCVRTETMFTEKICTKIAVERITVSWVFQRGKIFTNFTNQQPFVKILPSY